MNKETMNQQTTNQQTRNQQTENFAFHFNRLEQIAKKLQNSDVDIDELEQLVKQSLASKKYCEERINRVKASVENMLSTEETAV